MAALPAVHSGVDAAVKLHALLQAAMIDEPHLGQVLEGLLDLQEESGARAGCFRWYAEENEPVDTNASFFIGLALLLLLLGHPGKVPSSVRPRLERSIDRLNGWFLDEARRASPIYPNKYLGDLVCAWLGHEALDRRPPDELARATAGAFAYWENEHWGWGEHLSDIYAGILLTEFSALLLFARRLPAELRDTAHRLARGLLAIEERFAPGPRVPQIRSYDFNGVPARPTFRHQVEEAWPAAPGEAWIDARALERYALLPFGPLFQSAGWAALFPKLPADSQPGLIVPLVGGARAQAWVTPGARTGVLTRWPLVPACEYQGWGLSWQTFPAAYWRPEGDWVFLRFAALRDGEWRAHPAFDKTRSYLGNALGLGDPPPVGATAGAMHGSAWAALRTLPVPPEGWTEVTDGFWICQPSAQPVVERNEPGWNMLRLDYPDGPVRLHHVAVNGSGQPRLARQGEGGWTWTVAQRDVRPGTPPVQHLWALSQGPLPEGPPAIVTLGNDRGIRWPALGWPELVLDPPLEGSN